MIQGDTNPDVTWGREEKKIDTIDNCKPKYVKVQMWKVEVIEVRNRSEAKGFWVLHLFDGSWRFNPNNGGVTLLKGSLFPTFVQTKVSFEIQTPEGG